MSQAIFALIGALIGVLGTVVAAFLQAHRLDRRARQDALRSACAEFAASIARMGHLSSRLRQSNVDREALQERISEAHIEARVQYERLRLSTESLAAQEAARYALRHSYSVWMRRAGDPDYRADDYRDTSPYAKLQQCIATLYTEIRKELGVPSPEQVFAEPD